MIDFNRRQWDEADASFARADLGWGRYTASSRYRRAEVAMATGDYATAYRHLANLSEGIASGSIPGTFAAFIPFGEGQLARLEGLNQIASGYLQDALASDFASKMDELRVQALAGLATIEGVSGSAKRARELLGQCLNDDLLQFFMPLTMVIATLAELLVNADAETAIELGALAASYRNRSWFKAMYGPDEARITTILDRAREEHGIPLPDVPADLTAAHAIAECREALALIS